MLFSWNGSSAGDDSKGRYEEKTEELHGDSERFLDGLRSFLFFPIWLIWIDDGCFDRGDFLTSSVLRGKEPIYIYFTVEGHDGSCKAYTQYGDTEDGSM